MLPFALTTRRKFCTFSGNSSYFMMFSIQFRNFTTPFFLNTPDFSTECKIWNHRTIIEKIVNVEKIIPCNLHGALKEVIYSLYLRLKSEFVFRFRRSCIHPAFRTFSFYFALINSFSLIYSKSFH